MLELRVAASPPDVRWRLCPTGGGHPNRFGATPPTWGVAPNSIRFCRKGAALPHIRRHSRKASKMQYAVIEVGFALRWFLLPLNLGLSGNYDRAGHIVSAFASMKRTKVPIGAGCRECMAELLARRQGW